MESLGRDLIAAIQIHGLQVPQPGPDVLEGDISEAGALPDVEDVQVGQGLADLADALVSDLAANQGERSQVKQTAGDVNHRPRKIKMKLGKGDKMRKRQKICNKRGKCN